MSYPVPKVNDEYSDHDYDLSRPPSNTFDMDDSHTLPPSVERTIPAIIEPKGLVAGVARHTLGLILLLFVVFLWTLSNFLGSSIFADNTYAKPFFLTYLNTSFFTLCILPTLFRSIFKQARKGTLPQFLQTVFSKKTLKTLLSREEVKDFEDTEAEAFLKPDADGTGSEDGGKEEYLGIVQTARLSLAFCILWFLANYFAMACLQYTTVASTTILTSTSSVWTLLLGALTGTEKFTWRKLCGVLASLVGIVLISQVDLKSHDTPAPENVPRALDEFPDKRPGELALGDALALLSALIYGFYTITLKKTTVSALPKSIHMPTFFGLVGFFNAVLLFPLFPIFHFTGLERFALPPSPHIWMILFVNSISSLLSDICWAYAMVFTSPLVVTVGLSLTIPLSLIGEMLVQGRFESWVYWVGAMIVVGSFVFVEREEKHEEVEGKQGPTGDQGGRLLDGDNSDEDEGEPGPAIVVEDYDNQDEQHRGLLATARTHSPDLLEQMDDNVEPGIRMDR